MTGNRELRHALVTSGLRVTDVASALEVDPKTVQRWISQERLPYPRNRTRLAELLNRQEADLWPTATPGGGLAGDWWSCWESSLGGKEFITAQPVRLDGNHESIEVQALERGRLGSEGGCLWSGELRLLDSEILVGWYASIDLALRSNGVLYLRLHPQGLVAVGRRVGLSPDDGGIHTGWAVLARDQEDARRVIEDLTNQTGPHSQDNGHRGRPPQDRITRILPRWAWPRAATGGMAR